MSNLAISLNKPTLPIEQIDLELTDVTSWSERSGKVIFWSIDEVESGSVPIKDVLDFIEREQLNIDHVIINKSYDGNPCDDEESFPEIDAIIYLENNFIPTVEAYYRNTVAVGAGKEHSHAA